jgi:hypothetical protein
MNGWIHYVNGRIEMAVLCFLSHWRPVRVYAMDDLRALKLRALNGGFEIVVIDEAFD